MNQIQNLDHGLLNVAPSLVVGVWMDLETKSKFFQFPSTTTAQCMRLQYKGRLFGQCPPRETRLEGIGRGGPCRTLTAKWHLRVIHFISLPFLTVHCTLSLSLARASTLLDFILVIGGGRRPGQWLCHAMGTHVVALSKAEGREGDLKPDHSHSPSTPKIIYSISAARYH
ncbi:hypothetical protein BDZ97DRAFT_1763866 [Flammula alnicola]|nr:hypothetical protein BDZ97DRAFT_1763866 [Flammula alnicola]